MRVTNGRVAQAGTGSGRAELLGTASLLLGRSPSRAFSCKADIFAGGVVAASLGRCPETQQRHQWPLMDSGF